MSEFTITTESVPKFEDTTAVTTKQPLLAGQNVNDVITLIQTNSWELGSTGGAMKEFNETEMPVTHNGEVEITIRLLPESLAPVSP
ncbi:MAG: hypothetical protein MI745_14220 [Pseudomonadales bacterium]|nr:hypothetical protein [Pseudomonadales bacterium]